jgi:hypothetical protein
VTPLAQELFSWFADETALFHAKKQKGAINGALQKRFSLMLLLLSRAGSESNVYLSLCALSE